VEDGEGRPRRSCTLVRRQLDRADHGDGRLDVDIPALAANELTVDAPSCEVTLTAAYRSARRFEVDMGENDLARWCQGILAAVVACEGVPSRQ